MLEFQYPLLFILFIPLLLWPFLLIRKGEHIFRKDRYLIACLRAVAIFFLLLALTVPTIVMPVADKSIIFLVDKSASVKNSENFVTEWLNNSIQEKAPKDQFGIVRFAKTSTVDQSLQTEPVTAPVQESFNNSETNIEKALQLSSSLLKNNGGRIVLFSDGNETVGNSLAAAKLLKEQNIQLDFVELPTIKKPDAALTELAVSETMYEGEQANITVRITSNIETDSMLRISLNDETILQEKIHVRTGENVYSFSHEIINTGLFVYKAEIIPDEDYFVENNSLYAVANVKGTPKILLVENNGTQLGEILTSSGLQVERIIPAQLPVSVSSYLKYDSIIFNNIPGTEVTEQQMNLMEHAVKDFGKGFLMIGGEDSFGLGGYFKSPIERLLPVDMEVKGEEELPSLALMIVLDRSGSMDGSKLQLAKEAAARSVLLLREKDYFGFIAFDDRPLTVVETAPIVNKEEVIKKIRSISTGGGTEIYTALADAYKQLQNIDTQRKHIILLTDGHAPDNANFTALIESGKQHNITLSTVGIGEEVNASLLDRLADVGQGRYYYVQNDTVIPSILSRETVMITRTYIEDNPFYPKVAAGSSVRKLFETGVPKMNAYIVTTPKPTANISIFSEKDDPVLAEWQYGLGKTVAFTSDITGKWSGDFPLWENWPQFLNTIVTSTLPQYGQEAFSLTVENRGEKAVLHLTANSNSVFQLETTVLSQAGDNIEGNLKLVAPGHYEIEVPNEAGLYFLSAIQKTDNSSEQKVFQTGFTISYSNEYLLTQPNHDKLNELAKITGGKQLKTSKEVFREIPTKMVQKTSITNWLLLIAFFTLFLEFVIRRFGLRYFLSLLKAKNFKNKKEAIDNIETTSILLTKQKQKSERQVKIQGSEVKETKQAINKTNKINREENKKELQKDEGEQNKLREKQIIKQEPKNTQQVSREEQMKRLLDAKKRRK